MDDYHIEQRRDWLRNLPNETLQERNESRIAAAKEFMGRKYLLHPDNRVARIVPIPHDSNLFEELTRVQRHAASRMHAHYVNKLTPHNFFFGARGGSKLFVGVKTVSISDIRTETTEEKS